MHPYTTDAKDRENIPKYLALPAIISALVFNLLIGSFKLPFLQYIDTPAVLGFYGIILWLFDHFLWQWKFGSISPFSQIPNIGGTWVGMVQSSFQNTEVEVVVYIRQTWLKLSIELESDNSKSYTIMAAININAGSDNGLKYEYRNEPKRYGSTPEHRGTGHLHISLDGKKLEGKYYTSEGSNNTEMIVLHFLEKRIITRKDALQQGKQMHYI